MATVLLSYASIDNERSDVDFMAQDLRELGLEVRALRWVPKTGEPLWPHIVELAGALEMTSTWVLYVTPNSLGSTLCRGDVAETVRQLRKARGASYPVIALVPSPACLELVNGVKEFDTIVSLTDADWKGQLRSIATGRPPTTSQTRLAPFDIHVRRIDRETQYGYAIEMRPRAGTWAPFFAAIPAGERDALQPKLAFGPRGHSPVVEALEEGGEGQMGPLWSLWAGNEATPTESYFLLCSQLPTKLVFGIHRGQPQFEVAFESALSKPGR